MLRTLAAAGTLLIANGLAGAADLSIGDEAPAIDAEHWVRGEPVTDFQDGKVYVIDFWATWCAPCIAGMPHVSDLQDRYADEGVVVMAVSDEPLSKVGPFVESDRMAGKMRFRVAADPDGSIHQDYMKAAGMRTIPTAFIVGRDGMVEWIGNTGAIDEPLEAVVGGTWDRDAYEKEFALTKEFQQAATSNDVEEMLRLLDELVEVAPDPSMYRFQRAWMRATMLGESEAYAELRESISDTQMWNDAGSLTKSAEWIATGQQVKARDAAFCVMCIERALELTEGREPQVLQAGVRVHEAFGQIDEAVALQKQVVEMSEGEAREDAMLELQRLTETEG